MTFTFLDDSFKVYRLKKNTEHLKTGTAVAVLDYEIEDDKVVLKIDDVVNFGKCYTLSYDYNTFSRNIFDTEFEYDAEATNKRKKFLIEIAKVRQSSDISVAKLNKSRAVLRVIAAVVNFFVLSYLFIAVIASAVSGGELLLGVQFWVCFGLNVILDTAVVLNERYFKKFTFQSRKEALINTKKLCDENNINWEDGNSLIREANARESAKLWG